MSSLVNTCTPAQSRPIPRKRWRSRVLYAVGYALMTAWSLVMLLVALVTWFQCHRLYSAMAQGLARVALRMGGLKLDVQYAEPLPDGQVVYVANHGSTIDVIVLLALGLPNSRFFLSGHLRKKLPLALIAYLLGTFWTVPQPYQEQRRKIFQRAARTLRRTGQSVFLSPEGNQGNTGTIAPFNKGAFHLATDLQSPMVPLFIYLPPDVDPGWGYDYRPGTVHVFFQPAITTANWTLENLDRNRAMVRQIFLDLNQKLHA
jgi:1-acyl-sn-glycerol-3-phosphate acyltransferase